MMLINQQVRVTLLSTDGIKDFSDSPHDINKKAYSSRMGKGAQNWYASRLGFNMYLFPEGEFTLVIEFFPPAMDQVTVSVVSSSLNISQQSTRLFSKYSRSIIHLHKYDVTPPEYIFVDLKCQGIENSPSQGRGHLVIYGIEGKQNDVSSDVFDERYYLANGKLTFKTAVEFQTAIFNENIDMKNHQIKNVQDGVENNDTVNIKQSNEFEDDLVKFYRREMQTKVDLLNNKITELTT